jgi:hypothetical protein
MNTYNKSENWMASRKSVLSCRAVEYKQSSLTLFEPINWIGMSPLLICTVMLDRRD